MLPGKAAVRLFACGPLGVMVALTAHAQRLAAPQPSPAIVQALGLAPALTQLASLDKQQQGESAAASMLREQVTERVLVASFDVDEMLGRIDAEAAHVTNSRLVLEGQITRRTAELNLATFAISGALGTAGSAMQLTSNLSHAGNALGVASGGTALLLSTLQLKGHGTDKRVLLSPFNMLAQILGQVPNGSSHYPPLVVAYLHSPASQDGQLPDGVAPEVSLPAAWRRLHLLQADGGKTGASIRSVTTDAGEREKLTANELTDREAMLRDLGGAVSLLKVELRKVLISAQNPSGPAIPAR